MSTSSSSPKVPAGSTKIPNWLIALIVSGLTTGVGGFATAKLSTPTDKHAQADIEVLKTRLDTTDREITRLRDGMEQSVRQLAQATTQIDDLTRRLDRANAYASSYPAPRSLTPPRPVSPVLMARPLPQRTQAVAAGR